MASRSFRPVTQVFRSSIPVLRAAHARLGHRRTLPRGRDGGEWVTPARHGTSYWVFRGPGAQGNGAGTMTRISRMPCLIALPVALIAILGVTTVAGAASLEWSDPVQLRDRDEVYLSDAAYAGNNVAVVWSEYRPNAMGVRTSDDGGQSFGAVLRVARAGGQVALCGDGVYVALAQRISSDNIVVKLATSTAGRGNFDISTIAGGPGLHIGRTLSCNSGRVFVSWYESDGNNYRLQISSALVSTWLSARRFR